MIKETHRQIKIKQDIEKPVAVEIIANEIIAISSGIKKLREGPLNDKALFLLIQNAAPRVGPGYNKKMIGVQHIKFVLEGIESLEDEYLRKPAK